MSERTTELAAASALAYGAIGAFSLLWPEAVPRMFGGRAATPASRTEIRAVYGGLPLAFAATLTRAGRARDRGALRAVATASAGMAAGRLAGSVLERRLEPWPTGAFVALEAALAAALYRAA